MTPESLNLHSIIRTMLTKPLLTPVFWQLATLLLLQSLVLGLCTPAKAQDKTRAITLDEYKKVKTFQIKDLENETYVKFDNAYVLDRYEMRPPYVFKYSDGIERRIYLYRLLDNTTKASLGMVAMYVTPGDGKKVSVVIPNALADKTVWVQYIDDLKEYSQMEKGFGSTFSYVTSKEMAALAGGGSGTTASSGSKTDYDVCFPAFARVTLADGSNKPISEVKVGDMIASYNKNTGQLETATVQEVQIHAEQPYAVSSVSLLKADVYATRAMRLPSQKIVLEGTANHPVWTKNGSKALGQLVAGEEVMGLETTTGAAALFQVITDNQDPLSTAENVFYTDRVYNLVTDKSNYVVNNTVVLSK